MFELSIQSDIAAAHFLRGYDGPCKDLHGHTWKIEVVIARGELDAVGLVADFALLKRQLKEFLRTVDHVCLNDLAYFKEHNPTAENIARYVYVNFSGVVAPLEIKQVRVWESGTSSATYYE
ncbi:MAG: 6-carboxytetrahydropterin synthase [Candidatus Omnitrophica bacterium]|nr:6-carboxytetrahydropterin synthase [Candidatus Omnitrophota bacterium]